MRTLLCLLLAFVSASAFAQSDEDIAASIWYEGTVGGSPSHASADEACRGKFANSNLDKTRNFYDYVVMRGTPPQRAGDCYIHVTNPDTGYVGPPFLWQGVTEGCPSGFNPSVAAEHQHCHRPTTCASRAGQSKLFSVTAGYARSNRPNTNDIVINLPIDANQCDGTCSLTLAPVADSAWRSQVPASNGLHRITGRFRATYTGGACHSASPNGNPAGPVPPCPGTLGNVNGAPVCFGTGPAPLPNSPRPPNMPPEGHGNPPAGDVPPSGPITPAAGNGGPAGGGSNASIPGGGSEGNQQGDGTPNGTNPDGTGTGSNGTGAGSGGGGGIGMDPCGLPGTPPCKLDESGTPTGDGAYTGATNGVTSNRDQAVQGINDAAGASGKSTGWTFTFAFPSGCSEVPLAAFAPYLTGINVCSWQGVIHDLMSLVWLAATVFCCIGMVGRAVGGGGS